MIYPWPRLLALSRVLRLFRRLPQVRPSLLGLHRRWSGLWDFSIAIVILVGVRLGLLGPEGQIIVVHLLDLLVDAIEYPTEETHVPIDRFHDLVVIHVPVDCHGTTGSCQRE